MNQIKHRLAFRRSRAVRRALVIPIDDPKSDLALQTAIKLLANAISKCALRMELKKEGGDRSLPPAA